MNLSFLSIALRILNNFKNEKIKKEQKLTYKILFWPMPSTLISKLHRIVEILFFGQLYSFFREIKSDQKVSREALKKNTQVLRSKRKRRNRTRM